MDEDEFELTPQEENPFYDGIGDDTIHMDGDQYILEVQETVFLSNSDVTVQNFIPDEPDSIIIQDGIENFVIEDVCYSPILEETDICDNIIIPEQVLDLAQFPVPDILGSSFTSTSLTMPEHVLMSEALHMSDVEHIEHVIHDSIVEAEVISDPLTADISEILVADCASEAVLDSNGMPLEQQDNIQVNLDDTDKTDPEESTDVTIHAEPEIDPCTLNGTCPEVIKVYIFNADPSKDDQGQTRDISESETNNDNGTELHDQNSSIHVPKDKMVHMTVNDPEQEDKDYNVAEITNEVYMEVIVGDDYTGGTAAATAVHEQQQMDGSDMKSDFLPSASTAAYGNNSDETENRNVTASTVLHLDEPRDLDTLPKRKPKKKRRPESRHYPPAIIVGPDGQPLAVYPCVFCGKKFKSKSFLKSHVKNHPEHLANKKYHCTDCDYSTKKKIRFHNHMESHKLASKTGKDTECNESGNHLSHAGALSSHQTMHGEKEASKTYKYPKEERQHALMHQESKTYQCLHCSHKSSNSSDLKRHIISVHTKDYPHKCELCSKGFHRPSELKKHAATHESKKMHQCKHCDFKDPDPLVLNHHILSVHTVNVPFKCKRCKRGFQQQCELRNHMKTHSGRKVYQCEYCEYSTTDASGFKRHVISIHTKDYPHCCEYCKKGFRRPSEKNQHILRHHKEVNLP
ncbi:hypothetical protein ACRRTK_025079 [Alexandromys fortis]